MTRDPISAFYETYAYPNVQYFSRERMKKYAQPLLTSGKMTLNELHGKIILDAGCGTGEISCSLAAHAKKVIGIDLSESSLAIARKNANRFGLKNVEFFHEDIFSFQPEKPVDVVTAFGVLHHTHDAKKGFERLSTSVKPGGLFFHGFYHAWGGWEQRGEKCLARILGGETPAQRLAWVQKNQGKKLNQKKELNESEKAYWADRIANPREQYFRVPEITKWFTQNGFEIIGIQSHKPQWHVNEVNNPLDVLRFELEIAWRKKRFVIVAGRKK
jgi:2-polyprenyl-3-methyl-5-hydroxy-6-metoxy-1,4-benzoquinol methylase